MGFFIILCDYACHERFNLWTHKIQHGWSKRLVAQLLWMWSHCCKIEGKGYMHHEKGIWDINQIMKTIWPWLDQKRPDFNYLLLPTEKATFAHLVYKYNNITKSFKKKNPS